MQSILSRDSSLRRAAIGVCILALFCSSLGSVLASAGELFHRPFLIPIRTLVPSVINNARPEPNYQVRFVQWISPDTLKVRAAYQGQPSPSDIDLAIAVSDHAAGNPAHHVVALFPDYAKYPCFYDEIFQDEFPEFSDSIRISEGIFFSEPFVGNLNEDECEYLAAMPASVKPVYDSTPNVFYDRGSHSIHVASANGGESYQLSRTFELPLSAHHSGIFASSPDLAGPRIVTLPVKNSFWAVFALESDQTARLLLGPEETSANTGFIPRTMARAPGENNWMAYVGPEAQGGRWGISIWDVGGHHVQVQRIGKVGTNAVAYSEHRGFDHPVVWTGTDSILFLRDDELTLSHVRIKADGTQEELGTFSFQKGQKFQMSGEFLLGRWTHEFELFRLEAVSATKHPMSNALRIALVAVVQYVHKGVTQQTALPLVVDLSWQLQSLNQ